MWQTGSNGTIKQQRQSLICRTVVRIHMKSACKELNISLACRNCPPNTNNCSLYIIRSIHGISQARILVWVAISFSRGSSQPRDQSHTTCIGKPILYHWPTRKAPLLHYGSFSWHLGFSADDFQTLAEILTKKKKFFILS